MRFTALFILPVGDMAFNGGKNRRPTNLANKSATYHRFYMHHKFFRVKFSGNNVILKELQLSIQVCSIST